MNLHWAITFRNSLRWFYLIYFANFQKKWHDNIEDGKLHFK